MRKAELWWFFYKKDLHIPEETMVLSLWRLIFSISLVEREEDQEEGKNIDKKEMDVIK